MSLATITAHCDARCVAHCHRKIRKSIVSSIPLVDINDTSGLIGVGPIPSHAPVAAFQIDQIENLINTKGIIAYHYRFAFAPNRNALIAGVNVNSETANKFGVLFHEVRELKLVPYSLPLRDQMQLDGLYSEGSCVLNVAGHYADGEKERVFVTPRDLIVLNSTVTVQHKQLVDYNPNGDLRLKFRVKSVDYLASESVRYEQEVDFIVTVDGTVQWISGGRRPKAGEVLSAVYWFSPIYIVNNVPHSLRLLPSNDAGHGAFPRHLKYAPQLVICRQSHLIESSDVDFAGLPQYPSYASSGNTTGGSV